MPNYFDGRVNIAEGHQTVVMGLLSIGRKWYILWNQVKWKQ